MGIQTVRREGPGNETSRELAIGNNVEDKLLVGQDKSS